MGTFKYCFYVYLRVAKAFEVNILILSSLLSDEIAVYKIMDHRFFSLYILEVFILYLFAARTSNVHVMFVPLLHVSESL